MTTDSSELTFVRCPSCRSLVPAVSTRCRMCGATLDANAAESGETKRPSRVRQRTVSLQSNPVSSPPAFDPFETDEHEDPVVIATREEEVYTKQAAPVSMDIQDEEFDDPLEAYIEEVDEDSGDETLLEEPQIPSSPFKAERAEQIVIPERIPVQVEEPREVPQPVQVARPVVSNDPIVVPTPVADVKEKVSQPPAASLKEKPHLNGAGSSSKESSEPTPRVVEAGGRRSKEYSPSFSKPVSSPPLEGTGTERSKKEERVVEPSQGRRNNIDRTQYEAPPENGEPVFREEKMNTGESKGEQVSYSGSPTGKLCGWLVSYAKTEGTGYELRESKFFMSSKPLKSNDFIIHDRSVSTPHAMVNITRDGGFLIQDLMSERGVFIRRKGQDTYQREDGIVKCYHGDWIRIGDIEYLLSTVADLSPK